MTEQPLHNPKQEKALVIQHEMGNFCSKVSFMKQTPPPTPRQNAIVLDLLVFHIKVL